MIYNRVVREKSNDKIIMTRMLHLFHNRPKDRKIYYHYLQISLYVEASPTNQEHD